MGEFSKYSSDVRSPGSEKRRIRRYGGKTAGDRGTRRAGRMESRMQQYRKHRAARRAARKSAHFSRPGQVTAMHKSRKDTQRTKRQSMYRRHHEQMVQGLGSRTSLRERAQRRPASPGRGTYQRAGQDPNTPRGIWGQTGRRRRQLDEALKDY